MRLTRLGGVRQLARLSSLVAAVSLCVIGAPATPDAQSPIVTGSLSNFDVENETEQETEGFQIELEGIHSSNLTRVFGVSAAGVCYTRYCQPTVVDTATGVTVRWMATFDPASGQFISRANIPGLPLGGSTPISTAAFVTGEQCWTQGPLGADYPTAGCEHFGVSVGGTTLPTRTTYRWLVADPVNPGTLIPLGDAPVAIAAPIVTVTPPATPGAAPVVAVEIHAPDFHKPSQNGDAQWVKVFKNEIDRKAKLDELVGGEPVVPESGTPEVEWKLLQFKFRGNGNSGVLQNSAKLGSGKKAVVRRYEFYKFTGPYDAEHSPVCADINCDAPGPGEIGALIGAQMAGANVELNSTNHAPTIVAAANRTSAEGDAVSLAIAGADADSDALSYIAAGLPAGLTIDPNSGVITGTVEFGTVGDHPVTVTVSDTTATVSTTFNWAISHTNRAPHVTTPGTQSSLEAADVSLPIVASDADEDALTFTASGLPDGLAIDEFSGLISGTLSFAASGSHAVKVVVSDGAADSAVDFTWNVANVNRAPALIAPAPQTSAEGETVSVNLSASGSDPDGDPLTFSATGLPPGLTIGGNGVVSGTLGFTAAGDYNPILTVSDDSASSTSQPFLWTVNNTNRAPSVMPLPDRSDAVGKAITLAVLAQDPDGDKVTFSAAGLPGGVSIDPATGVIGGTLTAAGTFSVTVSASDGSASGSASFKWIVNAAPPPPPPPPAGGIVNPGPRTSTEGDKVELEIRLLPGTRPDADGDKGGDKGGGKDDRGDRKGTFAATGLPPGLAIDSQGGKIDGKVAQNSAGEYHVVVIFTQGATRFQASFTWTIVKKGAKKDSDR
jgi:hypothetical protein